MKSFVFCFLNVFGGIIFPEYPSEVGTEIAYRKMMISESKTAALKEKYRITDEKGKFFFKDPRNIKVVDDDSFFVVDDDQLLHFEKDGEFIKNIIRHGQGPGEVTGLFDYSIKEGHIYIYSYGNRLFSKFDINGKYLCNVGPSRKISCDFLGIIRDSLVIVEIRWPVERKSGKFDYVLRILETINMDNGKVNELFEFRQKIFVADKTTRYHGESIEKLSLNGNDVYGFHGSDYLIEVLDIEKKAVVNNYVRPYRHVPHVEDGREIEYRKKYNAPKIEYDADIQGLLIDNDKIIVKTSNANGSDGSLYDVWRSNAFQESFYIGADKDILAVNGRLLFVREIDKDGRYQIVIYERTEI